MAMRTTNFTDGDIAQSNRVDAAFLNAVLAAVRDAVGDGTDGPTTPAQVRTNLSLVPGTDVQAYSAALTAFAAFASNGLLARTAANTYAARTITGSGDVTVTDGDGVSGNPTIAVTIPVIQNYITGLTMSTAGSSATMSIAAGQASDSTNTLLIALASAMSKTTSAWAAGTGNGGLDTGAIANNTWYHFFLIEKTDLSAVDVLISTSPSAPTMPADYTYKRRIGSGLTNGSAQWLAFTQWGDLFQWNTPLLESTSANPGIAAVTQTLANVPTGVNVFAWLNALTSNNLLGCYLSDLSTADLAPAIGTSPNVTVGAPAAGAGAQAWVRTNTSAQIRTRAYASGAGQQIYLATLGWRDPRGTFG